MQQQPSSQRNSFFRANRPGNLNIINDVTRDSTIQQQQQLPTYNQQPLSASYSNSAYNNQANYSTAQQTNLNSPHYIQQSQISPSYSSYTGPYQSSKINCEQSFTPKYSPGPSSAHIANNQNYFNFDAPAKPSNTQIPQSPGPVQIQNKYNQLPSSPHLSNQAKNLPLPVSTGFSSQNQRYQTNYQSFSNSYQNPPHTPVSAIPYQSYNSIQSQHLNHSLSVPNSPIHTYNQNHHSIQNQHSVFQFNNINSNLANTNSNTNFNNNNNNNLNNGSNLNNKNNNININNNNKNNNNINNNSQNTVQNFNNFYSHNSCVETSRRAVTSDSFEFNPVDVNSSLEEFKQPSQTDINDSIINRSTYNENDVDMVHEVINNFIQKEENIKLSPKGFIISNDTSSSSGSNPNSNMNTSNNFGDNFEISFDTNSNHKDTSMDMLDINNNQLNENKTNAKSNIDSLTSVANRILNTEETMNESKQYAYSLTNLSEAASAEFLLNYAAENSKLKIKNGACEALDKAKVPKKPTKSTGKDLYSNSPQSFDEAYGSNVSDKLKSIDCTVVQGNSSIQTCSDCGKIFTNKSALAKHRLIHSNERKYSCHLCDKSFKRQDHLNGHLMTHSDKKPFVCKAPGCDKSYCDSRSLKRHVESQHQDFLAQLAHGNKDALNYLPSIGKIKANVAPNFQHEISVQDLIKNRVAETKRDHLQQYSPITPVPGQNDDSKTIVADLNLNNSARPKNFFTFEEPKPETCKICGKGFKNIPALNGHMRLHGGFIKTKLGVKSTSELANSDSNTSQSQQSLLNLQIAQPLSNSSFLFNEDSMSSNCSSNNSMSSNISSKNKKMSQCNQQPNLIQKQILNSENCTKQKFKDKLANDKEVLSNKTSYLFPNQQFTLPQHFEQNKKTTDKIGSNEKLEQGSASNLMIPPKSTIEFQLGSNSNTSQSYQRNFLDQNLSNVLPKKNEINSNVEQGNKFESNEHQTDPNFFSRILTNAFFNQAATAAAMVAAAMNQPQTQNNLAKPKPKPMPLIIPQAISAFQKTSYQKPPFYPQFSNGSFMPYIYPNATLLKSPRLFDTDTKKQYTPPPMLSPFRKGPGLFYNSKNINNLFSIHNLLNNKVSGDSNVPFSFNYHQPLNNEYEVNTEWHRNVEQLEEKNKNLNKRNDKADVEEFAIVQNQTEQHSMTNRNKLLNQVNQQSAPTGAFFPEDSISNETIAASLIEDSKNTKPFINLGSDFQAVIPEFKEEIDQEYFSKSEPEDLMWSSEVMEKLDSHELSNYLNMICRSSLVFGSSNNLELGLHILKFFDGDIKSSIKAFLDGTVELPVNHPITSYKYSETDIWTTEEIKKFETAILKHDKVFPEIAYEVETKSIMQCIEFYYLWKKVLSDNTKKKWKTLKKRRSFDETNEQNLRSSSNGKNDLPNENESEEACLKSNENDFDDQLDEADFASVKNYLKESQKNRLGVDENSKSRLSTPSPSQFGLDREKCNQGFASKRKLNQHVEAKQ